MGFGAKITKKHFFFEKEDVSSCTGRKSGVFRSCQGQKWRVGEVLSRGTYPYCPNMGVASRHPPPPIPGVYFLVLPYCLWSFSSVIVSSNTSRMKVQPRQVIYRWLGTYVRKKNKKKKEKKMRKKKRCFR